MTNPDRTSSVPLRYAVLHHTGHGEPHYDLMFETSPGSPLLTFRAPAWPVMGEVRFEKLDDHRPIYLDYEGPVIGGRGDVRAVARGTCALSREGGCTVVTFQSGTDHLPLTVGADLCATVRSSHSSAPAPLRRPLP